MVKGIVFTGISMLLLVLSMSKRKITRAVVAMVALLSLTGCRLYSLSV